MLYLWCKEGWAKSVIGDYHEQKQSLSRYYVGATILSEPVLKTIRQELRKLSPNVKIEVEQIKAVISSEIIKREVLEGEKAEQAKSKIVRTAKKAQRDKDTRLSASAPDTLATSASDSTEAA